jgi:hypothetical protein
VIQLRCPTTTHTEQRVPSAMHAITGVAHAPRVAPCLLELHQRRLVSQQGRLALPRRLRLAPCAARSSSAGGENQAAAFAQRAQQVLEQTAADAQRRVAAFVSEQRLDERAAAASKEAQARLASAYEETEASVRRTYMKLESQHDISGHVSRTRRRVAEAVRELDQDLSLRGRLRSTVDDVRRMLPHWRRQVSSFAATPLGRVALTLGVVGLLLSGVLWQLLNMAWLCWWASIPVSLFLAARRKQAAGAGGGSAAPGGGGSGSSGGSSTYEPRTSGDGPIVEAEWVSLDEQDAGTARGRSRR